LVFLLLAAAGIFLAAKLVPPYVTYWSMRNPVKEAAMAAVRRGAGPAKARADLLEKAKEQGLRLGDDDIEIEQVGSSMVVRVAWETPVEFPRYRHTLRFRLEEREPLP
jgi:hypothetical protein